MIKIGTEGKVLFFNNKAGWGLIESSNSVLFFVHYKDIIMNNKRFKSLKKGQQVNFIAQDALNQKFKRAKYVVLTGPHRESISNQSN